MASQNVAGNEVIVLSEVLEKLHGCLRTCKKHDSLDMTIAAMPSVCVFASSSGLIHPA
jgi:hypothetical protein